MPARRPISWRRAIAQFDPANPQRAEVQALAAFMYVLFAENYCNGVPTSQVLADGTFKYGRGADGHAAPHHRRRQVRLGDHRRRRRRASTARRRSTWRASARDARCSTSNNRAAAAAAVAAVPSGFRYEIQHSENTGRQNNAILQPSTISRAGSRSPTTRASTDFRS